MGDPAHGAHEGAQSHEHELEGRTRGELNQMAAALGVDEPEKLPNKTAVIEAIDAAKVAVPSDAKVKTSGAGGREATAVRADMCGRPPLVQIAQDRAANYDTQEEE